MRMQRGGTGPGYQHSYGVRPEHAGPNSSLPAGFAVSSGTANRIATEDQYASPLAELLALLFAQSQAGLDREHTMVRERRSPPASIRDGLFDWWDSASKAEGEYLRPAGVTDEEWRRMSLDNDRLIAVAPGLPLRNMRRG